MPSPTSTCLSTSIERETARLLVSYVQEGARGHAGGLENILAAADLTAGRCRVRDLGLLLRLSYLLSAGTGKFLSLVIRELRAYGAVAKGTWWSLPGQFVAGSTGLRLYRYR
jgi:hypothetical protein